MKNVLLYLLAFVIAGALGFGGAYLYKSSVKSKAAAEAARQAASVVVTNPVEPEIQDNEPESDEEDSCESSFDASAAEFEIDLSHKKVTRLSNGGFKVSGINVKGNISESIRYILSDNEGHSYESMSGTFSDVVAANTKGYYGVKAEDLKTGRVTAAKTIYGFKILKPVEKVAASEFTAIFNTGKSSSLSSVSDRISEKVKVRSNLPDVTTTSEVFMRVANDNMKATVTSVHYDVTGRADLIIVDLQ